MKARSINLIALILPFLLAACTGEEWKGMPDVEISFSPAVNASTRATAGVYPTDAPFTVWAYSLPGGKRWKEHKQEARSLATGHNVGYNGGRWLPAPSLEWPGKENVTCIACSPLGIATAFTKEKGVIMDDFDATSGILPMFTEPVADCSVGSTGGCIALPFVHALSKVEFEVRSVADSTIVIRSLTLDNIKYKGDFTSLPHPKWEAGDDAMRVEFSSEPVVAGRVAKSIGSRMLIGQNINQGAVLEIDILDKDGNSVVQGRRIVTPTIIDMWMAGKCHKYPLNLTTSSAYPDSEVLRKFDI